MNTLIKGTTAPQRPRCYMEYCCNTAVYEITDYAEGASGPYDPSHPVYEYRGKWGFCNQHQRDAE